MAVAALCFAAAAFSGALVMIVFDWSSANTLGGGFAGVIAWGGVSYLPDVRRRVPSAAALPLAPRDGSVRARDWLRLRLLLLIPFCVAAAWLADRWELGGFFVPGQFLGYACAHLYGAIKVGRWQRAHDAEVFVRGRGASEPELYMSA